MTTFMVGDEVRTNEGNIGILIDINPNMDYAATDEYWGEAKHGPHSFIIDSHEDVTLVRARDDIPKPRLPKMQEMRDFVQSGLHSGHSGGIEIEESEQEGKDEILAHGKSSTGQRFAVRVTLSDIEWADY